MNLCLFCSHVWVLLVLSLHVSGHSIWNYSRSSRLCIDFNCPIYLLIMDSQQTLTVICSLEMNHSDILRQVFWGTHGCSLQIEQPLQLDTLEVIELLLNKKFSLGILFTWLIEALTSKITRVWALVIFLKSNKEWSKRVPKLLYRALFLFL